MDIVAKISLAGAGFLFLAFIVYVLIILPRRRNTEARLKVQAIMIKAAIEAYCNQNGLHSFADGMVAYMTRYDAVMSDLGVSKEKRELLAAVSPRIFSQMKLNMPELHGIAGAAGLPSEIRKMAFDRYQNRQEDIRRSAGVCRVQ